MLVLRYVGADGDYGLKRGLKYICKVYSKDRFICIRVRNYALRFPRRFVYISYISLAQLSNEWVNEEGVLF